jgi:glyoxylase-like metal-dependent hydrolase (beta-lactamase superfamily II)
MHPANGVPVEVLPGILWLRLALPFALDHVNLWLIDDGDGWTAIDTGVADAPTKAIWSGLLDGGLGGRPLRRLLVTHFHPDHAGLAGWLVERTGAAMLMTRTEWLLARGLAIDDSQEFAAANEAYYRLAGLDEEIRAELLARGNAYRRRVSPPPGSFERVQAGDLLCLGGSRWQVIVGEGHAPEQITLWSAERNVLIAADQILPRISPVVGVWANEPAADPLGDFLGSLDRYSGLPEDALVLPSHGLPFHGLHARRLALRQHHDERLERVIDLCREPTTAAAVASGLFSRPLDLHQTGFALAEALAHLNRLAATGHVERRLEGGVWRWRAG